MAKRNFDLPIAGYSESLPVDKEQPLTSGYMDNVRPLDVSEKRLRIGQRPGLDKVFAQQVGASASPIVFITQVGTVD